MANMKLTRHGLAAALAMCGTLAACRSEDYSKADHKLLCDPKTGTAYMVSPGAGDISFVRPVVNGADICKKA